MTIKGTGCPGADHDIVSHRKLVSRDFHALREEPVVPDSATALVAVLVHGARGEDALPGAPVQSFSSDGRQVVCLRHEPRPRWFESAGIPAAYLRALAAHSPDRGSIVAGHPPEALISGTALVRLEATAPVVATGRPMLVIIAGTFAGIASASRCGVGFEYGHRHPGAAGSYGKSSTR